MPKFIDQIPRPLLKDLVAGRWLPIVGAGFSRNAHVAGGDRLPLWDELGKALAEDMVEFKFDNTLDAISAFEQEFSRTTLVERVAELLRVHESSPGSAHLAFCRLGFNKVVTTNFDMLLERGYEAASRTCQPLIEEQQLSAANPYPGPALLKLHGDLHHPDRLVLTEDDYDRFLRRHPIITTFTTSLLIDRTAVLIGYSLDDPDMRQLMSLIRDRLGRLQRPMYAVQINADQRTIQRFERRGVKVLNFTASRKEDWDNVLAELFGELREHWNSHLLESGQATDERAALALRLPPASSRIAFVAASTLALSRLREHLYPIVESADFTPLAARDVVTLGDTVTAKIDALIERASIIIVDSTAIGQAYELSAALAQHDADRIIILAEGARVDTRLPQTAAHVLQTPDWDDVDSVRSFQKQLFDTLASIRNPAEGIDDEPERLLTAGEPRAAVIAAIALLETTLTQRLDVPEPGRRRGFSLYDMLKLALDKGLILPETDKDLRDAVRLRNQAAHTSVRVSAPEAVQVIKAVRKAIAQLNGA